MYGINNSIDKNNNIDGLFNMVHTELLDESLKEIIKNRTKFQWQKLYIKRFVLGILNILFVAICSYAIILANINVVEIQTWFAENIVTFFSLSERFMIIAELAPTLVVSISNYLIIPVTKIITGMESWDYKWQ